MNILPLRAVLALICVWGSLSSVAVRAECHGSLTGPGDMCWDCMFPINVGGVTVSDVVNKDQNDMNSYSVNAICCACAKENSEKQSESSVGVNVGYFEPAATIDVVREPYCMAGLGGWSATQDRNDSNYKEPSTDSM